MLGILGKKLGMTQVFNSDGSCFAGTVIEAGPCLVLKTYLRRNYQKVQLAFDDVALDSKTKRIKKPQLAVFKKLKVNPKKFIKEVLFLPQNSPKIGTELKADIFKEGDFVDITGTSIGKGFQGGMKRWHWSGGFKTHGSTSKRRVGSIGASAFPSRVFKGHHMPGHMGNKKKTIQHLKIMRVVPEDNLLVVKGAVVGHKNTYLVIQRAKKKDLKKHSILKAPKDQV